MTPVDRLRTVLAALEERLAALTDPVSPPWKIYESEYRNGACWIDTAETYHAFALHGFAQCAPVIALAPVALRVLRDQSAELMAKHEATGFSQPHDCNETPWLPCLAITGWLATSADLVAGLGMETP